jgi:hypothetical protein
MVGGLYGQGDIRDKDIFYIGINTGLTFGNYGDWFVVAKWDGMLVLD